MLSQIVTSINMYTLCLGSWTFIDKVEFACGTDR